MIASTTCTSIRSQRSTKDAARLAAFITAVALVAAPIAASAAEPEGPGRASAEPVAGPGTTSAVRAGGPAEADEPYPVEVRAIAELGALGVLQHTYQAGSNGTLFDYKEEGGQNVLSPTGRLSAELELNDAHTFIFLYQPLQLTTDVVFRKPVVIDELTFPAGTPMNLRYGFDYYRMSYLYDTWWDDARTDFEIGLSLQIRNAVVDFTSADGTLGRSFQNIGLVPAIKLRARHNFDSGVWVAAEVDGMYAPVKYLNGGDSDVEGAIIDTSVRVGYKIAPSVSAFLNLREIGGGAEGTSKDKEDYGDGFNSNWLAFLTGSVGVEWTPSELW
jgi:hypothetical protein